MTPRLSLEEQQRQRVSLRRSSSDSISSFQRRSDGSIVRQSGCSSRSFSTPHSPSIHPSCSRIYLEKSSDNHTNKLHIETLQMSDCNTLEFPRGEKIEMIKTGKSFHSIVEEKETKIASPIQSISSFSTTTTLQNSKQSPSPPNHQDDAWKDEGRDRRNTMIFKEELYRTDAKPTEMDSSQHASLNSPINYTKFSEIASGSSPHREEETVRDPFLEDEIDAGRPEEAKEQESSRPDGKKTRGGDEPLSLAQENRGQERRKGSLLFSTTDSVSRSRSISWVDLAEGGNLEVMVSSSSAASVRGASRHTRHQPFGFASLHGNERRKLGRSPPLCTSHYGIEENPAFAEDEEEDNVRDFEEYRELHYFHPSSNLREKQDARPKMMNVERRKNRGEQAMGIGRKREGVGEHLESLADGMNFLDHASSLVQHARLAARKAPHWEGEKGMTAGFGLNKISSLGASGETFFTERNDIAMTENTCGSHYPPRVQEVSNPLVYPGQDSSWVPPPLHSSLHSSFFSYDGHDMRKGKEMGRKEEEEKGVRRRRMEDSRSRTNLLSQRSSGPSSGSAFALPEYLSTSSTSMERSWNSSSPSSPNDSYHPFSRREAPLLVHEGEPSFSSGPSLMSLSKGVGLPMFKGLSAIPLSEELFDHEPHDAIQPSVPLSESRDSGRHGAQPSVRNHGPCSSSWMPSSLPYSRATEDSFSRVTTALPSSSSSSFFLGGETRVQQASFSPSWCLIGSVRAAMPSALRVQITSSVPKESADKKVWEFNFHTPCNNAGRFSSHTLAMHHGATPHPFTSSTRSCSGYPNHNHLNGASSREHFLPAIDGLSGYLRWVFMKPSSPSADRERESKGGGIITAPVSPPLPQPHPLTLSLEKIQTVSLNQIVLEGHEESAANHHSTFVGSHIVGGKYFPCSYQHHIQERYTAVTVRMTSGCRPQQVSFGFAENKRNDARRLRTLLLQFSHSSGNPYSTA